MKKRRKNETSVMGTAQRSERTPTTASNGVSQTTPASGSQHLETEDWVEFQQWRVQKEKERSGSGADKDNDGKCAVAVRIVVDCCSL